MDWEGNTSHFNRTVPVEMWGSALNLTARPAFPKGGVPLVWPASLVLVLEQDKGSLSPRMSILGEGHRQAE